MSQPNLTALPPPPPPSDLIQSALYLPLSAIRLPQHRGRKLRFTGQILGFDIRTSLLLLASPSSIKANQSDSTLGYQAVERRPPTPTLLVNISVPLLGTSPASTDISSYRSPIQSIPTTFFDGSESEREIVEQNDTWAVPAVNMTRTTTTTKTFRKDRAEIQNGFVSQGRGYVYVNREKLRLEFGEFVTVVGWLEGPNPLGSKHAEIIKQDSSSCYAEPLDTVLEAIHISMALPPRGDEVYRGEVEVRG